MILGSAGRCGATLGSICRNGASAFPLTTSRRCWAPGSHSDPLSQRSTARRLWPRASCSGSPRWPASAGTAALCARRQLSRARTRARLPRAGETRRRVRRRSRRSRRGPRSFPSPRSRTGCAIPIRSTPSIFSACSRSIRSTRRPGARDRGTIIHDAIGDFTEMFAQKPAGRSARELDRARRKAFRAARGLSGGARVLVAALPAHRALVRAMGARAPRQRLPRLHAEIRGELTFPVGQREFTLSAARRPHRAARDGSFAMLDYKTGGRRPRSRCAPAWRRN